MFSWTFSYYNDFENLNNNNKTNKNKQNNCKTFKNIRELKWETSDETNYFKTKIDLTKNVITLFKFWTKIFKIYKETV